MKFPWVLLTLILFMAKAHASNSISYSGRLVNANGSPVSGLVNLTFQLAYSDDLGVILCSKDLDGVALANGVFHVKLDFTSCNLPNILANTQPGQAVSIRVIDRTPDPDKSYSFQAIHSVPNAIFSQISKQLEQMGATNGQVLTWNGAQWSPADPVGTVGGVVTIVGSEGISAVRVDETVTVGLVDGGVTAQKLNSMGASSGQVLKWNGSAWAPAADSDTGVGVEEDPTVRAFARNDVTGIAPEVCSSNQVLHYVSVDNSLRCFDLVDDAIVDGESNKAPSQNAVFDALALKQNTIDTNSELLMKSVRVTNDGTTWMGLKAPNAAGNIYFTLPAGAGVDGQVLKTDGAGNLTWVTPTTNSGSIVDGSIVDADIAASANIAQSKISGLSTSFTNLDNRITNLTTTDIAEGSNLYFTEPRVLGTDLAGLNTTNGTINSSDTVLSSIGKLIGNLAVVSTAQSNYVLKSGDTMSGHLQMGGFTVTGLGVPIGDTDAATKKYVDDVAAAGSSKWTKTVNDISYTLGNVGIGTDTPKAKLQVGSTFDAVLNGGYMGAAAFSGRGSGGANQGLFVVGASDLASGDRPLVGSVRARGTLAAPTAVQNGDQLFSFLGAAYDGANLQYPAMIDFNVDGAVTAGVIPASIDFITGSNAGNRASRMRVTSSGNVGIGTISPTTKLEIAGTSAVGMSGFSNISSFTGNGIRIKGSENSASDAISYQSANGGGGAAIIFGRGGSWDTFMAFYTNASTGSGVGTISERMRINSAGNVGVGTVTPNEKLTVEGNLSLKEGAAPTATANYGKLYVKTDSKLYFMNDSGTETALGSSDGGTPGDNTVTSAKITDGEIVNADISPTAAIDATKIGTGVISNTELSYLDGVTSNIQTQISNLRTVPAGSDTNKYLRGDNSWQTLDTSVVPETVSRQYFTQQRVLDSLLTGYAGASATAIPIADGESLLTSLKKLQLQITANDAAFDATGQWSKSTPHVYYDLGNVGIGVSNPLEKLHLDGVIKTSGRLQVTGNTAPSAGVGAEVGYTGGYAYLLGYNRTNSTYVPVSLSGSVVNFMINDNLMMKVNSDGNVGIGTGSPLEKLHVVSSSDIVTRIQNNSPGGNTLIRLNATQTGGSTFRYADIGINSDEGWLGFDAPSTSASGLIGNAGDPNMVITSAGNVGIGLKAPTSKFHVLGNTRIESATANTGNVYHSFSNTGDNKAFALGYISNTNNPYFAFNFDEPIGTGVTRMALTNAGHLGIGTTTPISLLEIAKTSIANGTESSVLTLRTENSSAGAGATIDFRNGNSNFTSGAGYTASIAGIDDGVYNGRLEFRTNTTGAIARSARLTSADAKMVIKANGNVGIGTLTPNNLLHIASTTVNEEGSPGIFIQDPTTDASYGGKVYYDDRAGVNAFKMGTVDNGVETGYIAMDRTSGRVGIGTTNPTAKLQIHTPEAIPNILLSAGSRDIATPGGETIQFGHWDGSTFTERMNIGPTGTVNIAGIIKMGNSYNDCPVGWACNGYYWDISTSGLYYSVLQARSDRRLKKNIEKVEEEAIYKLLGLNPVLYEWKDGRILGKKYGFIAQEVEEVWPELVATGADEMKTKSVDYMQLISPLVKGFQLHHKSIEGLNQSSEEKDRKIASLEEEVESLKRENEIKDKKLDEMKAAICEINPKAKVCQ